jgi:macrolide-specific efflux system membrane fusion protein
MSGMSAQVQFVVAQARDALLLPTDCLGAPDDNGQVRVNVVEAGQRVSSRKVKVGLQNAQQAQILSGLAAGDKVLVGPVPAGLAAQAASEAVTKPAVASGS